jgi:hypothetical protein
VNGGKSPAIKGSRIEREIVELHRSNGVPAERVPLSGAAHYQGDGNDVDIYPWGKEEEPLLAEVKARKSGAGFTLLEKWLADFDVLFLRRDRKPPLVVIPWETWLELMPCRSDTARLPSTLPRPKSEPPGATSGKPAPNGTAKGDEL